MMSVTPKSVPILESEVNFVKIIYGDDEELLMNPNCNAVLFIGYLASTCGYANPEIIDLVDVNGTIVNLQFVQPDTNVRHLFEDRRTYVPVMVEKSDDRSGSVKKVRPLLSDWEKKFPHLDRKARVLTADSKKKPQSAKGDPLSRLKGGVDNKKSIKNMGERSSASLNQSSVAGAQGGNAGKAPPKKKGKKRQT